MFCIFSPWKAWFAFKNLVGALDFLSFVFARTPSLWRPLPKTKGGAVVVH